MVINKELLIQHINQTGLNYSEIARGIEISRNTIYNVLFGETNPSYSVINSIAAFLELTENDFLQIFFPEITFKKDF